MRTSINLRKSKINRWIHFFYYLTECIFWNMVSNSFPFAHANYEINIDTFLYRMNPKSPLAYVTVLLLICLCKLDIRCFFFVSICIVVN